MCVTLRMQTRLQGAEAAYLTEFKQESPQPLYWPSTATSLLHDNSSTATSLAQNPASFPGLHFLHGAAKVMETHMPSGLFQVPTPPQPPTLASTPQPITNLREFSSRVMNLVTAGDAAAKPLISKSNPFQNA